MVPPSRPECCCIAQPTLNLIGQDDGENHPFACRMSHFSRGKNGGNIVGRMCRLLREIGVVEIEVSHQRPVGEGREVRRCLVSRAPHRCTAGDTHELGDLARNPARKSTPRAEGATQTIEYPALDLVNDLPGKIVVTKGVGVSGQAFRQHHDLALGTVTCQLSVVIRHALRRFCIGIVHVSSAPPLINDV